LPPVNLVEFQSIHNPGTLILRCDASVTIGTGHVMRCLALGQAWQDIKGEVVFSMSQATAAVEERIAAEKMSVIHLGSTAGSSEDAAEVIQTAQKRSARWIVVDGYTFDVAYQRALKNAGLKLLLVDDSDAASHCFADLVLNQNVYARQELYSDRDPQTQLLLGLRFAMLRREFASWSEWKREIATVGNKVLVTMGGSDPENVTLAIIEALSLVKANLEVVVVVGGSNPHARSLETAAGKFSGHMRLLKNVAMPELMAWADLAISSSGTTTAEICMLGLPAALIDIAPNQTPVAKELSRLGAAIHVGIAEVHNYENVANQVRDILASAESRTAISQAARVLVDGKGAQRVVSATQELGLKLRPAEERDCKLLWEWANDPAVRAASFHQEFIPWEQHVHWFQSGLRDREGTRIMMAVDSNHTEIGTVRFNLEADRAVVSISLDKNARGKGHGCAILKMAADELFRSSAAVAIDAYVKPQNEASQRLFENASFQKYPMEIVHGEQALHFALRKNGSR
jgi:UDP-2,4-diacetamido-2,4,6-trideoxy-beta-L-altropyranose hydrolase